VLTGGFPGAPDIQSNPIVDCPAPRYFLIVTVYDEDHPTVGTKLPQSVFTVTCSDGGSATGLTADALSHFTLEFDSEESLIGSDIVCQLTQPPTSRTDLGKLPPLRYGLSTDRVRVQGNVFRGLLFITLHWRIRVEVKDGLPPRLRRQPVLLAQAPVHFGWDGKKNVRPVTGDHGEPFSSDKMDLGTTYTVIAPVEGAIVRLTQIEVEGRGGQLRPSDYSVDTGKLTITVTHAGLVVDVRFVLSFEKVFIVGEGNNFAFACPLAKKYFGPDERYAAATAHFPYPAKADKKKRKWIIASQYDVNEPVETVENLFIYRDAEREDGRFDAIDAAAWRRLAAFHGDDFEAVLFNNPHPGYGMHVCEVMGMKPKASDAKDTKTEGRGRYISVHTLGSERLVGLKSSELVRFRTDGDKSIPVEGSSEGASAAMMPLADDAAFQRAFVQDILGIVRKGDDLLSNFTQIPPDRLPIPKAFEAIQKYDFSPDNFVKAATHYRVSVQTKGLKYLLLESYVRHGMTILKTGGLLCVNGSTAIAEDLEELNLTAMFKNVKKWKAVHKVYFVDYETNFTSESIHPSWLSNTRFNPGEPELENANVYATTK